MNRNSRRLLRAGGELGGRRMRKTLIILLSTHNTPLQSNDYIEITTFLTRSNQLCSIDCKPESDVNKKSTTGFMAGSAWFLISTTTQRISQACNKDGGCGGDTSTNEAKETPHPPSFTVSAERMKYSVKLTPL